MDRRSWPWKKKTSEKALSTVDSASTLFSNSNGPVAVKDDTKSEKYVQITDESYTYFSRMEDEMKTLNEKLLTSQSEMIVKDDLVKQHAKVAEEAVSGWEKAEAEALALKQELESVMLLKLTAEERSSHLDGALKECMKQIRDVKEESAKKLQDVVFTKTKQWEIVKTELETKNIGFEQELLKASAEISALSRSLQERSSLLMKVSEEKSQADAQIEVLKNNIKSCEREINSMEYELRVVTKEIEIRKEEKNMSMRSAEAANKQHIEDVKKITKLEAECQRLRGLVRKKLPGPAALAQMKEVKNLGREFGEHRMRRSLPKSSLPFHLSLSDLALENVQHVHEENEFLTTRLLSMEEEMKMLKEVLANRNSELQTSGKLYAKQVSKCQNMEAHLLPVNQRRSPSKYNIDMHFDNASNPPSATSMSEDGIDEEMGCPHYRANALISELSHFKKNKDFDNGNKADNWNQLEHMDDFIEMERLACLSTYANNNMNGSGGAAAKMVETLSSDHSQKGGDVKDQKCSEHDLSPKLTADHSSEEGYIPLLKLKSRIISIFESPGHETNMKKVIEDIGHIFCDTIEDLPQHYLVKDEFDFSEDITKQKHYHKDICEVTDVGLSLRQVGNACTQVIGVSGQELKNAISSILKFLVTLGKEDEIQETTSTGVNEINKKMEEISASVDGVFSKRVSLHDFVLHFTHILHGVSDLRFEMGTLKCNKGQNNVADCIDKETLLENKMTHHDARKQSLSGVPLFVAHSSFPDVEGFVGDVPSMKTTLPALSLKEFDDLKLEKEKVEMDLARCREMLDQTKSTLLEVEQQLTDLKAELTSCQNSNCLAETQLKCMAESYKMLESQKEELEAEIGLWRAKAETLANELQVERCNHLDHKVKCNEFQEQTERNMKCSTSFAPYEGINTKTQQEREIAAAAEKLTECQETIILLSRQLHALRNPAQPMDSSPSNWPQLADDTLTEETNYVSWKSGGLVSPLHSGQAASENLFSPGIEQSCRESPRNGYNSNMNSSDSEPSSFRKSPMSSEHHKQKVYSTSSSSSKSGPQKHGRGFRKLFSRGKSQQ